jgi:hypothetical protein
MRSISAAETQAKIDQAKLLYDSGVAPVSEVAKLLDMSARQFRAFRLKHGWPLRASACAPKNGEAKQKENTVGPLRGKPPRALIARLEDAIAREFARTEAALAKQTPKTMEASARTLASLVKTLAELKRMSRDAAPDAEAAGEKDERSAAADEYLDAPPRELAELRAELARRLERLRGEGAAG